MKLFKYCIKVFPSAPLGCFASDLLLICHQSCLKTFVAMIVNDSRIYYVFFYFLKFFIFILKNMSLFECVCHRATPLSDESGEGEREAGHGVVD